jgi:hypothetical protein
MVSKYTTLERPEYKTTSKVDIQDEGGSCGDGGGATVIAR